jgi:CheY-like chemotaxis protein
MNELKRILLVEDDPHDIKLILCAFDKHNLANEIAIARDGVEALDYLYRRKLFSSRPEGNPILILLDIKMPKLDGIQVLRELKSDEEMRCIPIVILTSSREPKDLEECYKLGVNAYVVKPVLFTKFVEIVKEIGMFWALVNESPSGSVKKR